MADITITYGDVPPNAKEHFEIGVSALSTQFTTSQNLKESNFDYKNYSNPFEDYQTVLDGSLEPFSKETSLEHLGIWSKQVTDENGDFENPFAITLDSDVSFTTQGFTLVFDNANDVYPTRVDITWKRVTDDEEDVDLGTVTFFPDSSQYFFQHKVEAFNNVRITVYSLNMPYQRLRVNALDFGYGTTFTDEELRSITLTRAIDPISSQIEIGTVDFSLDSNSEMDYSFQSKQNLGIYSKGELIANTFVKSSTRTGKTMWEVNSEDCISLLESCMFYGGIYSGNNAKSLIEKICSTAGVEADVTDIDELETVKGYIPYCTCREALMQVLFAIGAVAITENSDKLKITRLSNEVTQTIPLERIMQGQSFEEPDIVTEVKITEHQYERGGETTTVYTATKSDQNKIDDDGSVTINFEREVWDGELWWRNEILDLNGKISKTVDSIVEDESEYVVEWGNKYITLKGDIYKSNDSRGSYLFIKAFQYGEGEPTELYVSTEDDRETTKTTGTITLSFDKPYFDIAVYYRYEDKENGSITKTTDGRVTKQDKYIVDKGETYVTLKHIIYDEGKDQNEKLVVKGYPYTETTKIYSKKNNVALANASSNVKEITTATLVNSKNVQDVLSRCFNYLTSTRTVNLKIVEGKDVIEGGTVKYGAVKYGQAKYSEQLEDMVIYDKPVNLGDVIECETEYLGVVKGRVIRQSYNLNGNIVVKDTVVKCYDI